VIFDDSFFPFSKLHPNAGARLRSKISLLPSSLFDCSSFGGITVDTYRVTKSSNPVVQTCYTQEPKGMPHSLDHLILSPDDSYFLVSNNGRTALHPDAAMNPGVAFNVDPPNDTALPSSSDQAPTDFLDLLHKPKETMSQLPVWLPDMAGVGVTPSPTLTIVAPLPGFSAPNDPASQDPTPATPMATRSGDPGSGTSIPSLNSGLHPLHDVEASATAVPPSSSSSANPSSTQQQCVRTRL
jgi:hypothetical protein